MISTNLSNGMCTENAYLKVILQVYADHDGLFTISNNIVTNIVQM